MTKNSTQRQMSEYRSYGEYAIHEWPDTNILWVLLNPQNLWGLPSANRALAMARHSSVLNRYSNCGNTNNYAVTYLYALVTHPDHLQYHDAPVGNGHDAALRRILNDHGANPNAGPVIVAWGDHPMVSEFDRGQHVLNMIEDAGLQPMCLGKTKNGSPSLPEDVEIGTS